MAGEVEAIPEHAPPRATAGRIIRRIAIGVGVFLLALVLLAGALVVGINTDPGRRFVAGQINKLEMASGLRIGVGSLEGSLYGKLRIRGLTLSDGRGTFFTAPLVDVDWRPLAYIQNHVDIRSAKIPAARLMRLPQLIATGDENAPLLPDLDIDIGRLELGRLQIDAPVTGQRHLLSLKGNANIADGRARLNADAATIAGPGLAGGDRLALRLDAVPEDNRLDLQARLQAPKNGLVAGMVGLDRPLTATVGGKGSWKNWQGRADATLGGVPLGGLKLTARDGTFSLDGPLHPGVLMKGPVERLTAPFVQLNLVTTLDQRRADTRLRLRSKALAIAAEGMIDLGRSRFDNLKVAARLLKPGAIAPNLRGRDVQVAMLLNGSFGTPQVAYDLKAAAIGFGTTTVEGLRAQGRARIDTDRIVLPVTARATRISGLNPALGGLLTNVTVNGSLAISGPHVLSDNLRIRSDKVNATAIIVADISKGQYRGGLQGRVNNYSVKGIGVLDITTKLDVVTAGDGFGITGRVAIRTRRIDNASARDFLGGNATITADLGMTPAGVFTIDRLRVAAPKLRITSGSGRYSPDGRVAFQAAGLSTAYGPFTLGVSGTASQPVVRLRAARPGFGIGLANVDALVRGTGRGYAITAAGQSQYGPFSANVTVLTGRGPLTVDIARLTFAGVNLAGRIAQSAAGPFVGTLTMNGSGLSGTIRLAAAGRYQRADISARANGARIPGEVPILVQRAIIEATAILYPNAPSVTADVQVAGLRSGQLLVQAARARINYQNGSGRAQVVADGSSGVPFHVAANVTLAPDRIRAALQGNVNRIAFRLAQPADIHKEGSGWRLAPATLVLPQGEVRLAGRYGDGIVVQSRLDGLDLSILNAFSPNLGIGGKATGSVDFNQPGGGAFPRAEARLSIQDFTRTGIATRSDPVAIALVATVGPEGGATNAVIRRGGAVIGRAQVRLQPLSSVGGGWMQRLLASPLSGGIRYSGPAEVLWSLTGIADQQVSGPIGLAADFSGRVQDPQLTGVIRANALRYENEVYGTRITDLAIQGRFTSSRLEITQLNGRAGRGTISGRGSIDLAAASGFPIDVRLTLDRAQLARSDALAATVSGTIAVTNSAAQGALISGDLRLPEVRYEVVRQGSAEIAALEGVRRKGDPIERPDEINRQASIPSLWKLDLRVRADNEIFISGMGLESEWKTDLRVRGTSSSPVVTGTAEVLRGTYSFGGRRFELQKGAIRFNGSQPIDPQITLSASTTVEGVTATINVGGSARNPQITLTSTPSLPQDEILARLLFGNSVTELSATQALQLAASLNSLRGSGGGLNPLGKLRSATGIDRLRILGADKTTGRGTAIAAGVHISNDIYIEVITDARGFTATQLEVALSKSLSILSQAGSFNGSSINVRYRRDY